MQRYFSDDSTIYSMASLYVVVAAPAAVLHTSQQDTQTQQTLRDRQAGRQLKAKKKEEAESEWIHNHNVCG